MHVTNKKEADDHNISDVELHQNEILVQDNGKQEKEGLIKPPAKRMFGTFAGVFTPTLLTILGVIMYLRLGWVVGHAGVLGAILIIMIAVTITTCTGLSLSSIATNTRIGAGGPFAIISRSLGLEVGGSIGVPLFISQALAVAMYIFGFREGWMWIFPNHEPLLIDFAVFCIVFAIAYVSAGFAFKLQYAVIVIIVLSLVAIFGSPVKFEPLSAAVQLWGKFSGTSFWIVFAIFFPATTGIMAGANMSGELENPRRSIPVGTMSAIALSTVIFIALAIWVAHVATPEELVKNYTILIDKALSRPLVVAGLLGATFSSALTSLVGAPRILQALGSKRLLPFGKWFSKISTEGEPRNAIIVTGALVLFGLMFRDLNQIAPLISMFFLITYGVINVVVLVESSLGLISFRPSLRLPRIVPLIGVVGCAFSMFIINPSVSLIACALVFVLYFWLVGHRVHGDEDDVRSSVFEAVAEWAAAKVNQFNRDNPRAWKPNLLVPVENPAAVRGMHQFLVDVCYPEGSIKLLSLATKSSTTSMDDLTLRIFKLGHSFREYGLFTTWSTLNCRDYFTGVSTSLQVLQGAFFRPNVLVLTVPEIKDRHQECLEIIENAKRTRIGVLLYAQHRMAGLGRRKVINLWIKPPNSAMDLRGKLQRDNMHLAILISIQLTRAWKADLNLISVATDSADKEVVEAYLEQLVELCRLPKTTTRTVMVGNLEECTRLAPQSDVDIMGLQSKPDFDFVEKMLELTNSSNIFVLDSGRENSLA